MKLFLSGCQSTIYGTALLDLNFKAGYHYVIQMENLQKKNITHSLLIYTIFKTNLAAYYSISGFMETLVLCNLAFYYVVWLRCKT